MPFPLILIHSKNVVIRLGANSRKEGPHSEVQGVHDEGTNIFVCGEGHLYKAGVSQAIKLCQMLFIAHRFLNSLFLSQRLLMTGHT